MNKFLLSCATLMSLLAISSCNKTNEFSGSVGGYNQEVFSLVSSRCYECHANGNSEGGFGYIDDVNEMVDQGLISPSSPADSRMYKKIMGTASGAKMPWGGPYLNKQQSDAVLAWIGSVGTTANAGACIVPAILPTTATWSQVQGILNTKCVGCHQPGGDDDAENAWLMDSSDLGTAPDYAQMSNSGAVDCSSNGACLPYGGPMVATNDDPCNSRLYRRVASGTFPTDLSDQSNTESSNWSGMPKNGTPITDDEKAIIYKWIKSGASEN